MNCEYIYGYPFYTFQANNDIVETVYSEIKDLTYEEVFYSNDYQQPSYTGYVVKEGNKSLYFNKELYNFLDECLHPIYQKHFKYATNQTIVDLWPTKTIFGRQSRFHRHAHSVFSGLLYLHDCNSSTIFKFDDQIEKIWGHFLYVNPDNPNLLYESKAIKGKVIIWPSVIDHKIGMHKEKHTRYTIAFNSFWNGRLNSSETGFLDIKTTPASEADFRKK